MSVAQSMLAQVFTTALATTVLPAQAQSLASTGATLVVPAVGDVVHANDQATVTLHVEEQDADKAKAATRVNLKMNQGLAIVKQADPQAALKTQGYYTYPVYAPATPVPAGTPARARVQTGWRVGQYLQVKTANLTSLPKTVSAAQGVLGLSQLNFGLLPETMRKLDDERIAAAYKNLNQRVAAMLAAMGRSMTDAVIDSIDFEGSGNYLQRVAVTGSRNLEAAPPAPPAPGAGHVAEADFEPGETTLSLRLVAKIRLR